MHNAHITFFGTVIIVSVRVSVRVRVIVSVRVLIVLFKNSQKSALTKFTNSAHCSSSG